MREWSKEVPDAKERPKERRSYKCPLDKGFGSSISQSSVSGGEGGRQVVVGGGTNG